MKECTSSINEALEELKRKEKEYIEAKEKYKRILRSYIKSFK